MILNIKDSAEYDVIAIGSALLDLTISVEDSFLQELGLEKGRMQLVDRETSAAILERIKGLPMEMTPGGSSANTLAGILNFSGRGLFLGSVGRDSHGDVYISETKKIGVETMIGRHDSITGHAITFITPDSERTFAVHLGAALQFSEDDVPDSVMGRGKVLHLEGYLFELDNLNAACQKAMRLAKDNGLAVSIDLSDPSLIGRIYDRLFSAVKDYADIVFVNEDEARVFTGKAERDALDALYDLCPYAVVKLGAQGSLIKTGDRVYDVTAVKTKVVNTNGAGDMYAAGILYALTHGMQPLDAGKLASFASSRVVGQTGARLGEKLDIKTILAR
ncbi:MAG: hypothetical protein CVV44_13105 [Spirochaetae bacterium HGW-Spirochaetae-1]|jgi:sugar/nucleoside kinase (ribokinase family)|nr:MAG: hypothetical protein CVV44_13105 [Spirochaetae bacterium HGW-Spirochaetae-1]